MLRMGVLPVGVLEGATPPEKRELLQKRQASCEALLGSNGNAGVWRALARDLRAHPRPAAPQGLCVKRRRQRRLGV